MYKPRLDQLADGIFAIVMTLLVLQLHIPQLPGTVTNADLLLSLQALVPIFLSYILSFLVLITYWIAHHYMMSLIAQNLTRTLTYLNVPFLMTIALIPFSAYLLGTYFYTQVAIMIYGLNVLLIGFSLLLISHYVIVSPEISTNPAFTVQDFRIGYLRTLIPPIGALIAIVVGFYNPWLSIVLFIFSILVNLIPGSLHFILRLLGFEKSTPVS